MKNTKKGALAAIAIAFTMFTSGCSIVEPNYEGIKRVNWGKNGKEDYVEVKGNAGVIKEFLGEKLYLVPMYETTGEVKETEIFASDAGRFTVDPNYMYKPIKGSGREIVFAYKHVGMESPEASMDNIEDAILDILVKNAYKETAREYTTDGLMNNLNEFEKKNESRLKKEFETKGFELLQLTSGLTPPPSMAHAIEERNNSIQRARKAKNDLEIARMDQERAVIEQRTNQIKSQGLTDRILMERYIQMLEKTKNKVIITDGKTPIMLTR